MIVETVIAALEEIAPPRLAEAWDNVGLHVGGRDWPARRILLTIDLTEAVLEEALAQRAQMIIAYHPPIFEPLKAITDATVKQRIVLTAARHGIAIYSPHTALDAAPGGVNDWLAEGLGSGDVRSLQSAAELPESEERKIVTFCPAEAVERIRNGLASIGAGRIGNYQLCSFELRGTGTFLGGEGTSPAVGQRGELNRVDEVRLEMVCPAAALALAVMTLREFHPYEDPPIEIYQLQPRPQCRVGQGRRVVLDRPASLKVISERVKEHLGVSRLRVAEGRDVPSKYSHVGLCAGAGGALVDAAIRQECRLFLTGEMRHHDILAAQERGCTIVLAGHTNTERGYLPVLRKKLASALKDVDIAISRRDCDPLKVM